MFRQLANLPLPAHIMLVLLVLATRIVVFLPDYILPQEALLWLCGQKLASGGKLYLSVWYAGPPIMPWLYAAFEGLLGEYSLVSLRIATCIYLYLTAAYFNGILIQNKFIERKNFLPGILIIVFSATPWHGMELSAPLFSLLPITYAFHSILRLTNEKGGNFLRLFTSGFVLMLVFLADYTLLMVVVGVIIFYLSIRRPRTDELLTILIGMGLCGLLFGLVLFYQNSLSEFWRTGILTHFWFKLPEGEGLAFYSQRALTLTRTIGWVGLLIIAILGFIHFRVKYFTYTIMIRRVESAQALWLGCAFISYLIAGRNLQGDEFFLALLPLAGYTSKIWELSRNIRLRVATGGLLLLGPILTFAGVTGLVAPKDVPFISAETSKSMLFGDCFPDEQEQELITFFDDPFTISGVWILGFKPEWHYWTKARSATRYTDFRASYQRISYLSQVNREIPTSIKELDIRIFRQFKRDMPGLIIDPGSRFEKFKKRFPLLFSQFREMTVGGIPIYRREAKGP
ncbi:MAG: hypothetical protein AAGI38_01040 [Bacteroidota bacterium]